MAPEHLWRGERLPPLVLGTAQLGQPYGIANQDGQPSPAGAQEIVAAALHAGIDVFDTAQHYGDSEHRLGAAFGACSASPRVISKLSPHGDPSDAATLRRSIAASRARLGVPALYGMLLHDPSWLAHPTGAPLRALHDARDAGLVCHLGVSVYEVADARRALAHPAIEIVQVPCNAWDQSMLTAGVLEEAHARDKLCVVRSVLLQGLLVLSPAEVEQRLPAAYEAAQIWHAVAVELGCPVTTLAVRFALSLAVPLVLGVEIPAQLEDDLALLAAPPLSAAEREHLRQRLAPHLTPRITNPTHWRGGA
jgi:aryl-alcohol dehydrogenase-like predicted oxidoreductase